MRNALLVLFIAATLLTACQQRDQLEGRLGYEKLYTATEVEATKLKELRQREAQLEERAPAHIPAVEPMAPAFNPLDAALVSLSMRDEPLHDVLFVVARNAGLNLIIEPGISIDGNRVTVSFESAKSSTVIESLLKAYDLGYEVKDNVLYVKRFAERTFDLGFLNTKSTLELQSGGNIFGAITSRGEAGAGDLSSAVRSESSLGRGIEEGSLYDQLRLSLLSTLGGSTEKGAPLDPNLGAFTIDPIAGTLHVKTSPAKMAVVATLVQNLQRKLGRQVIIDARIMEVTLSDSFRFGIDWNYLANRIINGVAVGANISFGTGSEGIPVITIPSNFLSKSPTPPPILTPEGAPLPGKTQMLNATITALQTFGGVKLISNPHVRARHAQPAMFTSGRSERYVSRIVTMPSYGQNTQPSYSVETSSVFDGVLLGVLPFINDNGAVDIQIFPVRSVVNPSSMALVEVTPDGQRVTLPRIDIRNVSANVRVQSGDIVILGGLVDKSHDRYDSEVPGPGNVPVLGWLFQTKDRQELTRELVIIMDIRVVG